MQIKWRYTTVLCTIATGEWSARLCCDDAERCQVCVLCVLAFGAVFGRSRCSGLVHSAASLFCTHIRHLLIARRAKINYESQPWQRKPNFLIPFSGWVYAPAWPKWEKDLQRLGMVPPDEYTLCTLIMMNKFELNKLRRVYSLRTLVTA